MAQRLTTRFLETVKPGKARVEYRDSLLPGLCLVVQPTGTRSFAVRYRIGRRTRKYTIPGVYPAIDLKTGRDLGAKALRAVAEGRDPGREKLEARESAPDTIAAVVRQFVTMHCMRVNRPRTARETQRLLEDVLPRWRGRLASSITRRDVLDLLDHYVQSGRPSTANHVYRAVRKMFSWAVERDILVASPCAGIKLPSPEQSRDRVLSDDEIRAVWQAANKLGGNFGALVKLLILTGQRRDEVAGMRWSEINLDARLWGIARERVKNNKPHDVPLIESVIAILTALPRIAGSDFVLTTTGKAPSTSYSKGKRRLDALLPPDMQPWRLHDLRRTLASGMARLGVHLPVIEKILNHLSGSFGGIVGVYQRHDFADEKRIALQRWSDHVGQLVSGKAAKILALRR
jgi:integrase